MATAETSGKGGTRVRAAERTRRARQSAAATAKTGQAQVQVQAQAQAQAEQQQAQAQQERAAAALAVVNLDEWIAAPIRVAFTEWESVTEPLWDGSQQTVTRQIPRRRTAHLSTFIPSEVELQALSILQEGGLDRADATSTSVAATAQTVATARRVVLLAWQCFEPDMTLDRLAKGITLEQTMALMQRFFSAMMRLGQATQTSQAAQQVQAAQAQDASANDSGVSSAVSITAA